MQHDTTSSQPFAKLHVMRCLLQKLADGETKFVINYPNYGKVNVEVKSVDLTNPDWKPICVKILDHLFKEENEWIEDVSFSYDIESTKILQKVKRKWYEEWCMLDWFENIA